jgi:hypothetical protein
MYWHCSTYMSGRCYMKKDRTSPVPQHERLTATKLSKHYKLIGAPQEILET